MISRIRGKIKAINNMSVLLEAGELTYEILVPPAVLRNIENNSDEYIELITYHYYQTDPSKSVPILIGFLNEIEKEFFEKFISVSGVGPKAACKALTLPFSTIAEGIDSADMSLLKSLPGIGEQKAKEIIAKLQGKVGKFGLIQDRGVAGISRVKEDLKQEALSVLLQLQYKKKEAEGMIEDAVRRNQYIKTAEELLNEVYRQKTQK